MHGSVLELQPLVQRDLAIVVGAVIAVEVLDRLVTVEALKRAIVERSIAVCQRVTLAVTVFEVSVLRRTIHGRCCSTSALEALRSWKRSVAPMVAPPFSSSQKVASSEPFMRTWCAWEGVCNGAKENPAEAGVSAYPTVAKNGPKK